MREPIRLRRTLMTVNGGRLEAGAELFITRRYRVNQESEERVQVSDDTGKIVLPCVDPAECEPMPHKRTALLDRYAAALNSLHQNSLPFAAIVAEVLELHAKKSKDYGSGDDPYANVRASEEFGVPAWQGTLVRANDKVTRLKSFSKKGSLANESAEDSMLDLSVYFPIVLMLYREASKCGASTST